MSDDRKIKGPRDGNHVNVHEDHEVRYWTHAFDCTADQLRKAVKPAGSTHKDKDKVRAAVERITCA